MSISIQNWTEDSSQGAKAIGEIKSFQIGKEEIKPLYTQHDHQCTKSEGLYRNTTRTSRAAGHKISSNDDSYFSATSSWKPNRLRSGDCRPTRMFEMLLNCILKRE